MIPIEFATCEGGAKKKTIINARPVIRKFTDMDRVSPEARHTPVMIERSALPLSDFQALWRASSPSFQLEPSVIVTPDYCERFGSASPFYSSTTINPSGKPLKDSPLKKSVI